MSDLAKTLARLAAILGPPDGDAVALDGGIINRNFKVDFDGKPYVIRIPGKDTELLGIDRDAEWAAACAAARAGVGPPVRAMLEDPPVLVTVFVDGRHVTEDDLREPAMLSTLAGCLLFSIVTGTAFGDHDREWIVRHLPHDGSVRVQDVTSRFACFGLWGPNAREVLQPLTPSDLGSDAFPYRSASWMGAVLPGRVRTGTVARVMGGRRAAWPRGRGLPRDRLAPPGEGLPRLGLGHHAGRHALRVRPGLLCEARREAVHRSRRAGRCPRGGAALAAVLPGAGGPALGGTRQRAGARRRRDRGQGDQRRLRLHREAVDRLCAAALGVRRAGHRGGGRGVRRVGGRGGDQGAAARPPASA